jgi:hypothetical protein
MYASYVTPHRYSKITFKGYLMIALVCLLIASTIGG